MLNWIFKFLLKRKLNKDAGLQKHLQNADKELEELRENVKKMDKEGRPVPDYVKKYL